MQGAGWPEEGNGDSSGKMVFKQCYPTLEAEMEGLDQRSSKWWVGFGAQAWALIQLGWGEIEIQQSKLEAMHLTIEQYLHVMVDVQLPPLPPRSSLASQYPPPLPHLS